MTQKSKDDVEGTIARLMAQLEGIRDAYIGNAAQDTAGAPEAPEPPSAPPPAPALPPVSPPRVPSQAESVRAAIALFVVFFGLGAIVIAWFLVGVDEAQRLAVILIGVIATVVGYYFGQRGTTRSQVQAAYAMAGWQAAESRTRQLEDWIMRYR